MIIVDPRKIKSLGDKQQVNTSNSQTFQLALASQPAWTVFTDPFPAFFVILFETNLFLLSHRQVLVLKIGGTAFIGGFPVGLMKRKPLFLEENCEN